MSASRDFATERCETGMKKRAPIAAVPLVACFAVAIGAGALQLLSRREPTVRFASGDDGLHVGTPSRPALRDPSQSSVIDFGQIAAGGRAKASFQLENDSMSALEVAKIRTSCNCLRVELDECAIGPHGAVTAHGTIDLSDEPEFSGGLCPEAEFLDASGRSLFSRSFRATVGRSPTAAGTIGGDAATRPRGDKAFLVTR